MFPCPTLPNGVMMNLQKIVKTCGHYGNNGIWTGETSQNVTFKGTILPFSPNDTTFDPSGTYSEDNAKLFTYDNLAVGQQILDAAGQKFTILKAKNYNSYAANLNIYVIERVGATAR